MLTLPFEGYAVTHGGLALSPDGRYVAATSRYRTVVFGGPADPVVLTDTTWDGPVAWVEGGLLAVRRPGGFAAYDPATGREVLSSPGLRLPRAVAAVPGGRTLWVAAPARGGYRVHRYDVSSRAFVEPPLAAAGDVQLLAVSPGGVLVGGEGRKYIRAWRVGGDTMPKRAAMVGTLPGGMTTGLAASADGRYMAASARKVAVVWDLSAGGESCRVSHRQVIKGVAFHPLSHVLATASLDGTVAFWDPAAGRKLKQFAWDVGPLYAVAFAPDGLRCAAAGEGAVVVWDVE